MRGKTVSGIILILLLIGMLMLTFNIRPVKGDLVFSDDFDDGDISDWTVMTSGDALFEASTDTSVSSPYSVHMKSLGDYRAMGRSPTYTLDLTRNYNVSLYFRLPHTDNHWFEVFNNHQTYLLIDYYDDLCWYDGGSSHLILELATDQWYHIEIRAHPSSNTYDVYVDEIFKTTCTMWIHTGLENQFQIGDRAEGWTDRGEAYWDDIYIYQEPELPPTSINVDPSDLEVDPCHNFTVNVNVTNVLPPGCIAYEFKLYYNTTFMDGLSVELPPGHFLEPVYNPSNLIVFNLQIDDNYNSTHGRVWVILELLSPPEDPKVGSGVLVEITFHCTDGGETVLELADTILLDPSGTPIEHTTNDGHITSEAPPIIGFSPRETTVPITETFTVNVSIAVKDLYSWEFNMSFNPTALECLSVVEGPFLEGGGTTQFIAPTINNTEGTITEANCSLVEAAGGVDGTGTLATIEFRCKSVGFSILHLKDTWLLNSTSDEIFHTVGNGTVTQVRTVTYRLLAVEKQFDGYYMKSAQFLIGNLTQFKNWNNGTWGGVNYRSYIHLLSADPAASSSTFYRGSPTNANVVNEIQNFLGQTGLGESNDLTIRIFYYCGHTHMGGIKDRVYMQTDQRLYDHQLNQTLLSGDLATSNCTLIILDSCHSKGYIDDLRHPGHVIWTACGYSWAPPFRLAYAWGPETVPPGRSSWFTGSNNATYWKLTEEYVFGPMGIIGGLWNAEETFYDGWRTAGEIFRFAWNTTICYAQCKYKTQSPCSENGVKNGGIPLVMHQPYISYYDPITGKLITCERGFSNNAPPCTPPSYPPPTDRWDTFRGSPPRTGFTSTEAPNATSQAYSAPLTNPVESSPALADGFVFVGTSTGPTACGLHALDILTGKTLWTFPTESSVVSSPAVEDGLVFFGTDTPGRLYALYELTGLTSWTYEFPSGVSVLGSPAVVNGTVFIGTMADEEVEYGVYAFNQTTGEPRWFFPTAGPVHSSPAVADGVVIVGTMGGGAGGGCVVYALDEFSGEPVWQSELTIDEGVISTPAVADGRVFVTTLGGGGGGGRVYALEEFSGLPAWEMPFQTIAPITSSPAVDGGKGLVVIGGQDGFAYAISASDGTFVWSYPTDLINMSSPAISGNELVYIGSTTGTFYCLNETTGDEVWNYTTSGQIKSSPAITENHVFVGSEDGNLYCFGPPFPDHDVAVINVTASPSTAYTGNLVNITYTVKNEGNAAETFNVTIACNSTSIGMSFPYIEPTSIHNETVFLQPGANITKTYLWNTTDIKPGNYSIFVQADLPIETYEVDTFDNAFMDGTVEVKIAGDVNSDGIVDAHDLNALCRAYGSTPSSPNWNQQADINRDSIIDETDLAILRENYGKIDP